MSPPSPPPPPPGSGGGQIRQGQLQTHDEGVTGWTNKIQVWEDHYEDLKRIVDGMKPDQIGSAATTYGSLVTRMETTINLLYRQSERMIDAWGSDDAARKALDNMNKAYRQAIEIQDTSRQSQTALNNHKQKQTQWKQQYGSGGANDDWVHDVSVWANRALSITGLGGSAVSAFLGNNAQAEDVLQQINQGTVETNDQFPEEIRSDMPMATNVEDDLPSGPPSGQPPGSPRMPGGGSPPGGMPDTGGPPGGAPTGPGTGDFPGGSGPGTGTGTGPNGPGGIGAPPGGGGIPGAGGGGPGSDLASMPGSGPGGGPGGGGVPGGMPGGGPGGGVPAGAGLGGAGGAFPGGGAFGSKGMGAGGMGMGGMPMGGGAGGQGNDEEHERSTWLTEDEDVWGGGDETAPPVIG